MLAFIIRFHSFIFLILQRMDTPWFPINPVLLLVITSQAHPPAVSMLSEILRQSKMPTPWVSYSFHQSYSDRAKCLCHEYFQHPLVLGAFLTSLRNSFDPIRSPLMVLCQPRIFNSILFTSEWTWMFHLDNPPS